MTPFMIRVAELMEIDVTDPEALEELEALAPMPNTRMSQRINTSHGADRHVAIRALAEQLVCEANAVITNQADHLTLADEVLAQELAFVVGFRGRGARVSMTFVGDQAFGRLVGDGFESDLPRELESADDVPDLLIRLLVESGIHHPVTH